MKIILIVILAAVLYIGIELAVSYYKYHHLPALPPTNQTNRTLGSGPQLRYIAAGDSTSVGEGASSYEKSYAYQVAEYLAKAHTVEYKNIGVVGARISDVLDKQLDQIIAYKPDVVTISIGANDATHLTSANQILQNYRDIIAKLKQNTNAKVYITDIPNFHSASILPWFYISLLEYRSKNLNKKILALEDDPVKIVNIHDFGWSNYPDRKAAYAKDHFHPSDLGYENWTNAFVDKIEK